MSNSTTWSSRTMKWLRRRSPRTDLPELANLEQLAEALEAGRLVVYKHSPLCALSALTKSRVRAFAASCPDLPVYLVDVIARRDVSAEIVRQFGIAHASPQAIVIVDGTPVWADSHSAITEDALEHAVKCGKFQPHSQEMDSNDS